MTPVDALRLASGVEAMVPRGGAALTGSVSIDLITGEPGDRKDLDVLVQEPYMAQMEHGLQAAGFRWESYGTWPSAIWRSPQGHLVDILMVYGLAGGEWVPSWCTSEPATPASIPFVVLVSDHAPAVVATSLEAQLFRWVAAGRPEHPSAQRIRMAIGEGASARIADMVEEARRRCRSIC